MKSFSRFLIGLGVLTLIGGLVNLLWKYPVWEIKGTDTLKEIFTYALFESPARIAWVFGLVFIVIGGLILKKVKRKDRIFY